MNEIFEWLVSRNFAHRGLHDSGRGIYENSLSAVEAALSCGYGIEIDVQVSADGVAMVFHDDRLDRLTAETGPVIDCPADALERIALGNSDDTIPRLSAVLELVGRQTPLIIDIKALTGPDFGLEQAVASALKEWRGLAGPMVWREASFDFFADSALNLPIGHILAGRHAQERWIPRYLTNPEQARMPDFLACDVRDLPNIHARRSRRLGRPVLTWTVDSTDMLRRAEKYADSAIFEKIRPPVFPALS